MNIWVHSSRFYDHTVLLWLAHSWGFAIWKSCWRPQPNSENSLITRSLRDSLSRSSEYCNHTVVLRSELTPRISVIIQLFRGSQSRPGSSVIVNRCDGVNPVKGSVIMQSFWLCENSPSSSRKAKESNLIYGPIKNGKSQSMDIKSYWCG
jgi:hypothetical protein